MTFGPSLELDAIVKLREVVVVENLEVREGTTNALVCTAKVWRPAREETVKWVNKSASLMRVLKG